MAVILAHFCMARGSFCATLRAKLSARSAEELAMPRVIYIDAQENEFEAQVEVGSNVMEGAVDHMIDGILGECGGVMACATCHCYVDPAWTDKLEPASELEQDMLDMVVDPEPNSRLSCQIEMTDELDGLVVRLPKSQY